MYVTMSQSCWHGGIQRGLQDSPGITFLTEPMSRKSHCDSCEPILQLAIVANTSVTRFPNQSAAFIRPSYENESHGAMGHMGPALRHIDLALVH